jgi:hypothetical protein
MSLVGLEATKKRQELKQLLDHATLNEDPQKDAALYAFTADQNTYYRIKVLEKAAEPEILTFAEANTDDTLNTVKDRLLEKYYVTIRDKNPLLYQKEDQSWKDFAIVKDLVADSYFETILNAIATSTKNLSKEKTTKDQKAALRFYTYLKDSQARLIKDPTYAMQLIQEKPEQDSRHLSKRLPLAQQWRLEKIEQVVNHQEDEEAFKITLKEWSSIKTNPNGEMSFFQVTGKELTTDHQMIAQQTQTMHQLLSAEIQRTLMRKVLTELQSKGAISLNYLSAPQDESSATPEMES